MSSGKVVEPGERHHLPSPVNRRLFDSIRSLEVDHGSFQKVREEEARAASRPVQPFLNAQDKESQP
jgi:ketopantoate reductase